VGKLTLREAVKRFDVSKPTLLKHLSSGRVSGVKDDTGQWALDPSELARVYNARGGKLPDQHIEKFPTFSPVKPEVVNSEIQDLKLKLVELESALERANEKIDLVEQIAAERAEHIQDLRRLLPAPSSEPISPRPGFFRRWFSA